MAIKRMFAADATFPKPPAFGVSDAGNSIVAGDQPPLDMGDFPGVPKIKPNFFGQGGVGRAALGGLFDSIISQTGGGTPNRDAMMLARKEQFLEQQANRKRIADYQDWVAQQRYKAANPAPLAPTEFDRALIASGIQPGTPEWTQAYKTKVQNTLDPIVTGSIGGRDFFGPRSVVMDNLPKGGGRASGGPAPGAVEDGYRFKGGDPSDQRNWEPVAGGPTPTASGGFPRY